MAVLIGVDEAGYGPNYGPLAVAATAWRVEEQAFGCRLQPSGKSRRNGSAVGRRVVASPPTAARFPDLYKLLRKAVVRSPAQCTKRLAIADSKALYKAGLGVRQLERGVLAALACTASRGSGTLPANGETCAASVAELLAATLADPLARRRELPCHADDQQTLPIELEPDDLPRVAALLQTACEQNGVALLSIRARLVFPAEFNSLVEHFGTKGAALSHVTLELVRQVIDGLDGEVEDDPARGHPSVLVCLDKHGGRNWYAALLQHHFADSWIDTIDESRAESRYQWKHGGAAVEAVFRTRCEEMLATALASMTAKYHRELIMRAFNAFWTSRVPGLRPTCGYPGDSHRFKADIAAAQRALGIEDRLLWRCR